MHLHEDWNWIDGRWAEQFLDASDWHDDVQDCAESGSQWNAGHHDVRDCRWKALHCDVVEWI